MVKALIVDCDPGIDDALALLFAFASGAKIEAITTTAGNVDVGQTTRNLLNILRLLNCKRMPHIGRGGRAPLCGRLHTARSVHGRDGLGNSELPQHALGMKLEDATSVLAKACRAHPGITIVATGPLTNIAELFLRERGISRLIGRLVIMGGALRVRGNVSRFAEFNIGCDPEAAAVVFGEGAPVELVSLDVTHKAVLRDGDLHTFRNKKDAISKFILTICEYGINYHRRNRQVDGMYMHDPLAMAIALRPSLGEFENLPLGVKLKGRERGRIYIKGGRANVRFCRDADVKNFLAYF